MVPLGMGLFISWWIVLLGWVFAGVLRVFGWSRPGLPRLPVVSGPYQHFQAAILDACRDLNSACLCRRKGFRGGPLLDFRGSMQLLFSSHVRDRDEHCFGEFFPVVFGMVFSLGRFREKTFLVVPVGVLMVMVTCFGIVPFPHWLLFGGDLSSMVLSVLIRLPGPGVFCGMVGCLRCLDLNLAVFGLWVFRMLLLSALRWPWVPM